MSEMKVTLVANAAQPVSEIAKLTASANETAKSFAATAKAAVDGSKAATGSFQDLKGRLTAARAELDKLAEGSTEFADQAATVKALNAQFAEARQKIAELTAAEQGIATGKLQTVSEEAQAAAGSFQKLQEELAAATAEMNRLQVGSDEWKEQAGTVARLTVGIDQAKQQIKELVAAETALQTGVIAEQATEAKAAAGSFRALNQELRENVAALEEMAAGSNEFADQKKKVDDLRAAVEKANQEMATSAKAVVGSYKQLESELRDNEAALKSLAIGSEQFEAQRKKVDQLKTSLEKAKGELTELSDSAGTSSGSWKDVGASMAVATGAAAILYGALKKVADVQDQIIKGAADEVTELDTLARRLQIQAGLTDPQKAEQTKKIVAQSTDAGVKAEVGFAAATQLAGSGFQNAVDGGSLKIILDTIQASSFQGAPEELVSAFTETLNAYGLEKNNKNLEAVAIAAQSLFKVTDFQLAEAADFAKSAAVFKSANISLEQSMAAFTSLREVLPAAESGTGLRNFVNILQGGAATKESVTALGTLGLQPGQVDFVGENLNDVIATINTATAQMDEAAKNVALLKVFGRENVASAKLLLANADRVKELETLQQNKEQFKIDLGVAAGGIQAERNRIQNRLILDRMPIADELARIDTERRRLEEELKVATEKAAVSGVPLAGAAAAASSEVIKTADSVVGGGVVNDVNKGLFETFRAVLGLKDEDKKAKNAALEQNAQLIDLNRQQLAELAALRAQAGGRPAVRAPQLPRPAARAPAVN